MYILFYMYLFKHKFVVLKRTVSLFILTNTQCFEMTIANPDQMRHHAATHLERYGKNFCKNQLNQTDLN